MDLDAWSYQEGRGSCQNSVDLARMSFRSSKPQTLNPTPQALNPVFRGLGFWVPDLTPLPEVQNGRCFVLADAG